MYNEQHICTPTPLNLVSGIPYCFVQTFSITKDESVDYKDKLSMNAWALFCA